MPTPKAIEEREASWATDIPKDESGLWDWLSGLDDASRSSLLAHCVSYGVNALHEKVDRYGGSGMSAYGLRQRLAQVDRLARAVNLDMVEAGWRPTVDNYLDRVTKTRILEAVREAKGESSAQLIDHMKKPTWRRRPSASLTARAGCQSRCASLSRRLNRPAVKARLNRSRTSSLMTKTKPATAATTSSPTRSRPNSLIQRGDSRRPASSSHIFNPQPGLAPGFPFLRRTTWAISAPISPAPSM